MAQLHKMTDTTCFVCGYPAHADTYNAETGSGHNYWATADAFREAREHDAKVTLASTPESRYVSQWRPY